MGVERPLDLSVFKQNACAIGNRPAPFVKISLANNQDVDGVQLEREGIDMFAVPTLLRRWATVIENQLVRPGEAPEMVVEDSNADGEDEAGGAPLRGDAERDSGQDQAMG